MPDGRTSSLDQWYESLHHRLDALLREPSISMSRIVAESVRHFKQLVGKNLQSIASVDWEGELSRSIHRVVMEGNPVMSLFFKRICKILLCGLLNVNYRLKLPAFSLNSTQQVLFKYLCL